MPTLGTRPNYLRQTLLSIGAAGNIHVCIVAPSQQIEVLKDEGIEGQFVVDQMLGLSSAINQAISELPDYITYVNWLGDDDLLIGTTVFAMADALKECSRTVFCYGQCEYITEDGQHLWTNRPGYLAVPLMRFGPQLVPQPGALFRRSDYQKVGGLKSNYQWAFDLDLLLRLRNVGDFKYFPQPVAKFRWHSSSLSVAGRWSSVVEASAIRREYLPKRIRIISNLWEWPLKAVIYVVGKRLTLRANRSSRKGKGTE